MEFTLTKESMEMLTEEIVYAVHESANDNKAKEWVKQILEENGIIEIKEENANEKE